MEPSDRKGGENVRMMNRQTGVMVKVVENRGNTLLIVHPVTGAVVEAPAHLYLSPPRCVAEREMRRQKEGRRKRWQFLQAVEARARKEEELKEKVRGGEVRAILYKEVVFPIVDGDGLAEKLLDEMNSTPKTYLRKQIEQEMVRRCKHWHVREVFNEDWLTEMNWAYREWLENEKLVARWLQ
jgi:hypothetical protein